MNLKGKRINFLGDSITAGVGTSSEECRFVNLFLSEAEAAEARNYGISGTRLANQTDREHDTMDNSYSERLHTMEQEADIVVVFGGTNDYGHGDAPFGTSADRTPDTYCGACHYILSELIKKYPEALIVVMTPIHRENEWNPSMGNGLPLKSYVDALKEAAEYYSVPVLDLYAMGGIYPDIPEQKAAFCPDGLHPNDAGNRLIFQRLRAFIENNF